MSAPAATVDLDTRLALASTAMDVLFDQALLRLAVSTAHLPDTAPVELVAPPAEAPVVPEPQPAVSPLAAVFRGALRILGERGWARGALRDDQGAVCAVAAIRAATGSDRGLADDACAALLAVIQQRFVADTLPSWNDSLTSAEPLRWALTTATNQH
ncbi:hypothetical protein ACFTXJ_14420 [Streptomyces zhihengii]|uniref:DUF6197 family protein n=1 Tax=Streptomyces zhihengii TaxID=1818004 RepID=UPI00364427C8